MRTLSKSARGGDPGAHSQLVALIHGLSVDDMHGVARAFAHFLNLSNIESLSNNTLYERLHVVNEEDKSYGHKYNQYLWTQIKSIFVDSTNLDFICGLSTNLDF